MDSEFSLRWPPPRCARQKGLVDWFLAGRYILFLATGIISCRRFDAKYTVGLR